MVTWSCTRPESSGLGSVKAELSGQRVRARWGRATHARGSMRGASKVENRQSVFGRVQACRVCLRAGRCSGQGRGPDMTLVWPSFFGSWRWLESRGDFPGIAQLASIPLFAGQIRLGGTSVESSPCSNSPTFRIETRLHRATCRFCGRSSALLQPRWKGGASACVGGTVGHVCFCI